MTALFETTIGTPAYMRADALHRALHERPWQPAAHLLIDPTRERDLFRELKQLPAVSAVTLRRATIAKFHETMAEMMPIFIGFFAAFLVHARVRRRVQRDARRGVGRARELAALRVLGQTRFEISYILLGEIALLALLGFPVGCAVGAEHLLVHGRELRDGLYRMPLVLLDSTFEKAVRVRSRPSYRRLIVRRRLDHLDLVAVLKTREWQR